MSKRSLLSIPAILLGKLIRLALRISRHSGSALPGKIILQLDPHFLQRTLKKMKYGVVLVSGTNGKTTTAHIISQILENQGLKVFTNRTGSNFSRGIASELIHQASVLGNLKADVAVLELDEAYGVSFSREVNPNISVFLNVFRDQLDRFGELEHTAEMLTQIAKNTQDVIILNQDDNYIRDIEPAYFSTQVLEDTETEFDDDGNIIPKHLVKPARFAYFGVSDELKRDFINDDAIIQHNQATVDIAENDVKPVGNPESVETTPKIEFNSYNPNSTAIVEGQTSLIYNANSETSRMQKMQDNVVLLEQYAGVDATYDVNGYKYNLKLQMGGIFNALNCAAAISTVQNLLGNNIDGSKLISSINAIEPAFGRGETISYKGDTYTLILVKNPAGFRLALKSYEPDEEPVMIIINDDYADSRDVSWLYDVDHSVLGEKSNWQESSVISGRRAYDMQLKFEYANMPAKYVIPNIEDALAQFTQISANDKRIYATYTSMLKVRSLLRGSKKI